jgi:two-component sensor histidine kinase
VLGEWFLIATSSALALAGVATAFSVFPPGLSEWLLTIPRLMYRYAVPGLLMTLSYGLMVESQRRLDRANDALMTEERRRVEILDKARQLDRDVAEALHRNVQARLAAAVVLLRLDQRQEAWTLVMEMTSVEIPWLLERMGEAPASRVLVPDPPMGLTVIQVDELPVDDGTFDLLTRAVAEIAVNARRHGRASTLVVSLHATAGRWQVTCEDDGTGIPVNAAPGLGSRLLDDTMSVLAGSWTMESSHPGCRITLDFPVRDGSPLHVTASGLASSGA